jgi:hypothetical protein
MEHAGYMRLSEEEVGALRKYLHNGGALFVNDFWGAEEWNGFAGEIKRVLPGRSWTELNTEHPIFNCVYDLRRPMNKLHGSNWGRSHISVCALPAWPVACCRSFLPTARSALTVQNKFFRPSSALWVGRSQNQNGVGVTA